MEDIRRTRSSLEHRTKLGTLTSGAWVLVLYPDAAEGGGSFRSAREETDQGAGLGADSTDDAARRARGQVRRYCAANRLNRLGTLTYAGEGCHDPAATRRHVGACFRRLRRSVGRRFAYLWTTEWHKSGHGLHVHFAVGRYIQRAWLVEAWPHGFVHIKLLGDLPVGSTALHEARKAARYLSKYVGKDLDEGRGGLHRYDVAQGFQPRTVEIVGRTADEVLWRADQAMGRTAVRVWRSRDVEDWAGPPAVWASWE